MSVLWPGASAGSDQPSTSTLTRAFEAIGLLLAVGGWAYTFSGIAAGIGHPSDFSAYYLAGRAHQLGLDYYQRGTIESLGAAAGLNGDFGPFLYPPLFAAVVSPLAALDYASARWLWAVMCLGCLLLGLAFAQRAAGLAIPPGWRGPLLAFVALFPPVADDALKGQITSVLLLLLAGAWLAHQRGRPTLAGALVALAASVKLAPALVLVYFALRRDYRALAAGAVAGLALIGASIACAGPTQNVAYVTKQVPFIGLQIASAHNVSLQGTLTRLFATFAPGLQGPLAEAIVLSGAWLLIGAFLAGCARAVRRRPAAAGLGYGGAIAVLLLATPSSQAYTLVLTLLPLAALAARFAGPGGFDRLAVDLTLVDILLLSIPPGLLLAASEARGTVLPGGSAALAVAVSGLPTLGLLLLCALVGRQMIKSGGVRFG